MARAATPTDDDTYAPRFEAPEGSAERVREEEPPFVTDYANGEAVDVPVVEPASGTQVELFPDMPKRLPLWPDFDGRPVTKVRLAFAGECDLTDGAQDRELASQTARLGNRVTITISGTVAARNHKEKGLTEAHGTCAVHVDEVRFGEADDYDDREEAREEAAEYAGTIASWCDAAAELVAQFEDMGDDDIAAFIRRIAGYKLPSDKAAGSDSAASNDVEESEVASSTLDQALAEAMA